MVTDPVCFAIVDDESPRFISIYKDQRYYFCTNYCRKKFDENPERYTRLACDLNIDPGGASC
jgi:YHS domain-containing protein